MNIKKDVRSIGTLRRFDPEEKYKSTSIDSEKEAVEAEGEHLDFLQGKNQVVSNWGKSYKKPSSDLKEIKEPEPTPELEDLTQTSITKESSHTMEVTQEIAAEDPSSRLQDPVTPESAVIVAGNSYVVTVHETNRTVEETTLAEGNETKIGSVESTLNTPGPIEVVTRLQQKYDTIYLEKEILDVPEPSANIVLIETSPKSEMFQTILERYKTGVAHEFLCSPFKFLGKIEFDTVFKKAYGNVSWVLKYPIPYYHAPRGVHSLYFSSIFVVHKNRPFFGVFDLLQKKQTIYHKMPKSQDLTFFVHRILLASINTLYL